MSQHSQSQEQVLTAAKQTMAAWSRLIESHDEIPAIYKSHFDQSFGRERDFPHVIWTPALERFPRRTTEKLICDTKEALHIFEKIGHQIEVTCYPYHDVCGSEVGIVLLDSWLTVYGKTSKGEASASKIEVNTTSLRYFASIQRKLRPALDDTGKAQFALEKNKFNVLAKVNFKFMNFGRDSLLPGETVAQFLLQPEIRQPWLTLFGKTFYKTLSLAHLTILTDHELILLQDADRNKDSKLSQYGGVWQYIPLNSIETLTVSEADNNRLTLSIHCQQGRVINRLFEETQRIELERLQSQF